MKRERESSYTQPRGAVGKPVSGSRRCRPSCLCALWLCRSFSICPGELCRIRSRPPVRGVPRREAVSQPPGVPESVRALGRVHRCGFVKVHNSRGHAHRRGGTPPPVCLSALSAPRCPGGWALVSVLLGVGLSVMALGVLSVASPSCPSDSVGAGADIPALYLAWPPSGFVHPLLGGGAVSCVLLSRFAPLLPLSRGLVAVGRPISKAIFSWVAPYVNPLFHVLCFAQFTWAVFVQVAICPLAGV